MLFTGKGDSGKTKIFNCSEEISKSSELVEALGSLDELNSYLGIVKVLAYEKKLDLDFDSAGDMIHDVQKDLFIIQAELAGSKIAISQSKVENLEKIIAKIEKTIPPIKTFCISGGTELSAHFDMARALARRVERRVVASAEKKSILGEYTLAYLNRLSSFLYALARFANAEAESAESSPDYI